MTFGEHLRVVLEPVNKAELARELDITRNAISKWVCNRTRPNVVNLVGICKFVYGEHSWQPYYLILSQLLYEKLNNKTDQL